MKDTAIHALLEILENPWAKKGYKQLQDFYNKSGFKHEAASIDYLIKKKFHVESSHPDEE